MYALNGFARNAVYPGALNLRVLKKNTISELLFSCGELQSFLDGFVLFCCTLSPPPPRNWRELVALSAILFYSINLATGIVPCMFLNNNTRNNVFSILAKLRVDPLWFGTNRGPRKSICRSYY
jgi:hypothetical protein